MTKTRSRRPALFALSVALRGARLARGMSLRALAGRLEILPATLSAWETGDRRPPAEAVAWILGFLQVSPEEHRRVMLLHSQLDSPGYVEALDAGTTSLQRTYEQFAVHTLEWAPYLVPEPLQTPDHLRAMLQSRGVRPDDVDQAIFTRQVERIGHEPRGRHTLLLGAAALAPEFASPEVRRGQLRSFAALSHTSVRVVPGGAGAVEPFTLYETEGGSFTVALRHQHTTTYLTDSDATKRYRSTFKALQRAALSCEQAHASGE
jgi:transcriptional regulator with XRE-family HTH domain